MLTILTEELISALFVEFFFLDMPKLFADPRQRPPGLCDGHKGLHLVESWSRARPRPQFLLRERANRVRSLVGSRLPSITLLSGVIYFLRECRAAIRTMSGRSQQPRPDRFQDLLQRQTRSFFLPPGSWSG